MYRYEAVIVGGGPAGLAAALEIKAQGIEKILIIERDQELGGILQQCIHNGFGLHEFKEEMTGPAYAQRFIEKVKENNIEYLTEAMVMDIQKQEEGPLKVTYLSAEKGLEEIETIGLVLAMGCRERTRGALSIPGSRPAGIWSAGTAQRYVNIEGYEIGKRVFILGSGDIGLIMARRMTLEGAEVLGVAEVMPFSGGLNRNIVQCLNDYDIPLYLSHTVTNIFGKDRLEGIELSKVDTNRNIIQGSQRFIPCDTLLLSVGLIPENELSEKMGVRIDPRTKGPSVTSQMSTTVEGVFACGNVVHVHDLVDFVSKESRAAGKGCSEYIKNYNKNRPTVKVVATLPGEGVSYIVPQKVRLKGDEKIIDLFFRVKKKYGPIKIIGYLGEQKVLEKKLPFAAPGEMIKLAVAGTIFGGKEGAQLTLKIEGESDE